jgi:cytochrome c oxidase cbb3-type subunit 4
MTLGEFSAYGYFILTVSLSILFMGYVYHLYTARKKGTKDYEKYSNIALHDELTDELVEEKKEGSESEDSERKMEG